MQCIEVVDTSVHTLKPHVLFDKESVGAKKPIH